MTSYAVIKAVGHLPGPYTIPNVQADVYCVYTNRTPATAMRGFGITGVDFAIETHMDKVAHLVGMDPIELRILNAYRDGDMKAHRRIAKNTAVIECCQVAAEKAKWPISPAARQASSLRDGGRRATPTAGAHRHGRERPRTGEGAPAATRAIPDGRSTLRHRNRHRPSRHLPHRRSHPTRQPSPRHISLRPGAPEPPLRRPRRRPGRSRSAPRTDPLFIHLRSEEALMALHRGRGFAAINYPIGMNLGGDPSQALVHSNPDGKFMVALSSIDLGQGMKSVTRQIAAETLGIPVEDVYVDTADSDTGPHCMGSFASRGTHRVGNAVIQAAREARAVMLEAAAEELEVDASDLVTDGKGNIHVKGAPSRSITTADACGRGAVQAGTHRRRDAASSSFRCPTSIPKPASRRRSPASPMPR